MRRLINGHNLNIEVQGPPGGSPVILLHHGLGAVQSWTEQLPVLEAAGFRSVVYDRWGYGLSDPRPSLDIPAFEADQADLLSLVDSLGIKRASLVGHSDGGTIALLFASRNPDRVERLAVVAAHIFVEPRMVSGMQDIREAYGQNSRFQEGLFRLHGEKTEKVFSNWFDGWLKPENLQWDLRQVLTGISCPTLVIQGCDDEHTEPQHARELAAAVPGAELWLLKGASHMLPQDWAEEFNPNLIEFLAREPERTDNLHGRARASAELGGPASPARE